MSRLWEYYVGLPVSPRGWSIKRPNLDELWSICLGLAFRNAYASALAFVGCIRLAVNAQSKIFSRLVVHVLYMCLRIPFIPHQGFISDYRWTSSEANLCQAVNHEVDEAMFFTPTSPLFRLQMHPTHGGQPRIRPNAAFLQRISTLGVAWWTRGLCYMDIVRSTCNFTSLTSSRREVEPHSAPFALKQLLAIACGIFMQLSICTHSPHCAAWLNLDIDILSSLHCIL